MSLNSSLAKLLKQYSFGQIMSELGAIMQRAEQDVRLPEASADMRDAIREERVALDACADGFARASAEVQARGDELFG